MKQKVNIKDLFIGFQEEMKAKLNIFRKSIPHPGTKGDATEDNWINWLSEYLPNRYCVDKAFVIDCEGNLSDQIDVVIYDQQYSPFIFNKENVKYIPAESVYAVFEVKQNLNKEHLNYTANKLASVRNLRRTNAAIIHAGGKIRTPKPPFDIIGGILTTTSDWVEPLGDSFESCLKDVNEHKESFVNMGCAISNGSFITSQKDGLLYISRSSEDEVLLFFFLNLFMALQQLGTVPAIDIVEYAKVLKSI